MSHASPTFTDLMAQVGLLMLHWGFLENALREAHGPRVRLQDWPLVGNERTSDIQEMRDDLRQVRRVRNLIAHGLVQARADPTEVAGPFVLYEDAEGRRHRLTYEELKHAISKLERWTPFVAQMR